MEGILSNTNQLADSVMANLLQTSLLRILDSLHIHQPISVSRLKGKTSGSSGYYDTTAKIYETISLTKRVELYKDYQKGESIQELYKLGARNIGVRTLPPLGCLPAVITIFGEDSNECVEKINKVAISFNKKLNSTSQNFWNQSCCVGYLSAFT